MTESAEGGEGGLECHGCEVVFPRTKWDYRFIYLDIVVNGRKIDPDLLAVSSIQMQKWRQN